MPAILRHVEKDVEADGKFPVARVEIHHVIRAATGNVVQNVMGKVAVRVDHAHTLSIFDVLKNEIPEEGRFSRTRFAQNIEMVATVFPPNAQRALSAPHG